MGRLNCVTNGDPRLRVGLTDSGGMGLRTGEPSGDSVDFRNASTSSEPGIANLDLEGPRGGGRGAALGLSSCPMMSVASSLLHCALKAALISVRIRESTSILSL